MTAYPSVSIGIPMRNAEHSIGHVLKNISKVDYPQNKLEVIIGDHCSTDDSVCRIHESSNNLNIRVVRVGDKISNRAHNRNQILKHTSAQIVIFIDADILVSRQFVKEHVHFHQQHENAIVAGYTYGKLPISKFSPSNALNYDEIETAEEVLAANPIYHDYRISHNYIKPCNGFETMNPKDNPWRFFWTCNISIKTSNAHTLRGFDERYSGWGLEDDDFAYKCHLARYQMIFSERAWCFHIPHHIDPQKNLAEWKNNLRQFSNKWQNRESEMLHYYLDPQEGEDRLTYNYNFLPDTKHYEHLIAKIRSQIPTAADKRLAFFVNCEKHAEMLDLTDCCNPFTKIHKQAYTSGSCTYYSYIGIKTHFADNSIDEVILLVDVMMYLDEITKSLLLLETCRISKTAVLVYGEYAHDARAQSLVNNFNEMLSRYRFNNIVIIGSAVVGSEAMGTRSYEC